MRDLRALESIKEVHNLIESVSQAKESGLLEVCLQRLLSTLTNTGPRQRRAKL